MGLKKEIREDLRAIRAELFRLGQRLDETEMVNEQLRDMNQRLMAERKELLDRIMSVNYEKFQLYNVSDAGWTPPPGLTSDQLEEMAGEAFELGDSDEA